MQHVRRIRLLIAQGAWRYTRILVLFVVVAGLIFVLVDQLKPLPDPAQRMKSVMVLAADNTPLRAFADAQGVWRFPAEAAEISPLYIEALLAYEDRWFYWHPGVNPLALLRALWQWGVYGEIVSGGSTITMQVARILEPHSRDLPGKLWQMFRALQLEWHYSKADILQLYLNLAPFGGPIEGVQTAAYAYLHKPASSLSHAEAALLAVLPQAPSRLRPDRHPQLAQRYRNKVLRRMRTLGVWEAQVVEEALMETVNQSHFRQPFMAPLLARRMVAVAREQGVARLTTTLDSNIQWSLENILRARQVLLPEQSSAAVLVMENETGKVHAYAGSVDFHNAQRFGQVDMVAAVRSPGSTLKPFLYGYALDDGLIHSASLLSDVPLQRQKYAPDNFMRHFKGAVSVREALQLSLNVPAVTLLQHVGVDDFYARLMQAGIYLQFPGHAKPNLSMILGGGGVKLEQLVQAHSAFSREGMNITPRFTEQDPVRQRRVLSKGAAGIINDILQGIKPPGGGENSLQVAWKTGTSYGFRDAWAVGSNRDYTVGVWTGRPDGTALPGQYGARVAGPIMFDVFHALPRQHGLSVMAPVTDVTTVQRVPICWPLGLEAVQTPNFCHKRLSALILNDTIPPTLPNLQYPDWSAREVSYWVHPVTGKRLNAACDNDQQVRHVVARWPLELAPWLSQALLQKSRLPDWDESCPPEALLGQVRQQLQIENMTDNALFYLPGGVRLGEGGSVTLVLQASGGVGELTWLLNETVIGRERMLRYALTQAGRYELMVIDQAGGVDKINLTVLE